MDWIGAKVDWINKIRFFAHPQLAQPQNFLPIFLGVLAVLRTAACPQSQIGLKPWVREAGTLRCTQLLQYEEDDWVRDIAATKLQP